MIIPNHVLAELDNLKRDKIRGPKASQSLRLIKENRDWLILLNNKKSHSEYTKNVDYAILEEISEDPHCKESILITNDKLLSTRAKKHYSFNTETFHKSIPFKSESQKYTGFSEDPENPIINSFTRENGKVIFHGLKEKKAITYEHEAWKIKPRTQLQNLAFELLLNPDIDVVTIQSEAGFGKTTLSLAAAFKLAFEQKESKYRKVFITKSYAEMEKLGFLPGDIDEKFSPAVRPIIDLIMELHEKRNINKIFKSSSENTDEFNKKKLEILPITFMQGMNIKNSILIIDEAQNLTRDQMRAVATRCGENTKLIAIGDTKQSIWTHTDESNNGLNWIVKLCKGESNYGHIVLSGNKSRGPVTDLMLKVGL